MEKVQTQSKYSIDTSFEKIWAVLDKTSDRLDRISEQQKETALSMKETDRRMKETDRHMKETDRMIKETTLSMKETDRMIKEIGKNFGNFTNNFGDVVEYMIAPNLQEKFNDLGYDFQEASTKVKIRDKKNNIKFEIDVYLQNGDIAMLVEIKSKLLIGDINDHIERLEKMRKYADLRGDTRHFLGAVAGIVIDDKEREYALNQGFFLIEPTGENFYITPPHNEPKEW